MKRHTAFGVERYAKERCLGPNSSSVFESTHDVDAREAKNTVVMAPTAPSSPSMNRAMVRAVATPALSSAAIMSLWLSLIHI